MSYSTIILSLVDGVGRLTLNRPDRLNAFTAQMHVEVADALDELEASGAARVLLLTGAGRGFCAGQDLTERKAIQDGAPLDLGAAIETHYAPLVLRLAALPFPVVCAVNGVAAGAGANIALACDLVIATASAKFIQSFVNVGLMADSGGAWILPRLVGRARALGLLMTGEPIAAADAADWGMIWRAVEDGLFHAEVETTVARLAKAPTLALAAVKQAVRESSGIGLAEHLALESGAQRRLGASHDYAEGVTAFFQKRAPVFRGA
jgi:2-(1,2-epoxy-1,2-dihydrophenyl)acetyl-CoA isomerase